MGENQFKAFFRWGIYINVLLKNDLAPLDRRTGLGKGTKNKLVLGSLRAVVGCILSLDGGGFPLNHTKNGSGHFGQFRDFFSPPFPGVRRPGRHFLAKYHDLRFGVIVRGTVHAIFVVFFIHGPVPGVCQLDDRAAFLVQVRSGWVNQRVGCVLAPRHHHPHRGGHQVHPLRQLDFGEAVRDPVQRHRVQAVPVRNVQHGGLPGIIKPSHHAGPGA